ncbi:MAG: PorV/PorQ family protein [Candidatus Zixiibacteriota bacterium]
MKPKRLILATFLLLFAGTASYGAKYAGDAFSLGAGARGLALGGAIVAGPFDASAPYWNPAGLNSLPGQNIIAMHAEMFGSLLNHDFAAYTRYRGEKKFLSAYGIYFYYLGGGGIKLTDLDPNTGRPFVVREESHSDIIVSGAIAGKLKEQLDWGVSLKFLYRDLATVTGYGVSADLGAVYKPFEYLNFGLTVADLFTGHLGYSNGSSESINPTVKPGILFTDSYKEFRGRLVASGDFKFEGIRQNSQYWMGDISMDLHFGAEISYLEMVFLRAGSDIGRFTGGVGVEIKRVRIDAAYLNDSEFDETIRLSLGYSF